MKKSTKKVISDLKITFNSVMRLAAAVRLSLINDNSRLKAIYKSAKVGSDSEPSRGRLQPNRRAERDFCGKGGAA